MYLFMQIREGLEEGIDLSKAKSFNAGALKELHIATLEKIDIDPYISVDKRGAVIREIALGLENNLDVSQYNSFLYTASEMEAQIVVSEVGIKIQK